MNRNRFFHDLLTTIGDRGRNLLSSGAAKCVDASEMIALCRQLLSTRGEASGMAIARKVHTDFTGMSEEQKLEFFVSLAREFGANPAKVLEAARTFVDNPSPQAQAQLARAVEPPRHELFRRLNLAPGGTASLVEMRSQLLRRLKSEPELAAVDVDLAHMFTSWFNRGFLVLRTIDWTTPAHILEKIIDYEAVHEIHDWEELRQRLEPPDRRCAAFFHPSLGDEPLIFVQVALTLDMPGSVQDLLDRQRKPVDAARATTAVFYSISNCQNGLLGISFGSFLIKQVVEDLKRDLGGLKTFATLSPVPGFSRWVAESSGVDSEAGKLVADTAWVGTEQMARAREVLMPLAAEYFLKAKNSGGMPRDPVARFHLNNGARLERINWLGDRSAKGLAQSAGIMVNYRYKLSHIEENHEAYVKEGRVAAARQVRTMLVTEKARDATQGG